jgi:hypothetical protein
MPFEQRQALYKADCEVDPVDQILKKTPDYELEYEGFEEDWYEDHFDPGSYYGHYQTGGVYNVNDFIYKIDAVTLYEFLADFLNGKLKETSPYSLTNEYNKLAQACIDAEGTDEEEAVNEVADVFLAQNLHDFAEIYYEDLLKYYHDDAYEWARDHLDILDALEPHFASAFLPFPAPYNNRKQSVRTLQSAEGAQTQKKKPLQTIAKRLLKINMFFLNSAFEPQRPIQANSCQETLAQPKPSWPLHC